MCSYNGKTQPRPHDNQLAYVGGETKILAVNRNIKFNAIKSKLSSICNDADLCFKYQLPGEDLDALISVTNDEDLKHMMLKYDRLLRGSAKPARLRFVSFCGEFCAGEFFDQQSEIGAVVVLIPRLKCDPLLKTESFLLNFFLQFFFF